MSSTYTNVEKQNNYDRNQTKRYSLPALHSANDEVRKTNKSNPE